MLRRLPVKVDLRSGQAGGHQLLRLLIDHARGPRPEPAQRPFHLLSEVTTRERLDREQPEYRDGGRAQLPRDTG